MIESKKLRKKVAPELRRRILAELGKEECAAEALAKEYDISLRTLHRVFPNIGTKSRILKCS